MSSRRVVLALAVSVVLGLATNPLAQQKEHPKEHPQEGQKKEHPEHPAKDKATVSVDSLAEAITGYINKDSALKGGYFVVFDSSVKAPLALTLDKVHRERLSKVADGVYFACSDFKATNGKTYDLDFFMKQTASGLEVSEVIIHKEDGKARYNWVEEKGIWKRKPL